MEVQAARLAGNLNSPPWRGVRRREDSNQLREEDDRRQPREDDINSETTTQHMVGLSHLVIFYFFVFSIQNTDYLQTVPALLHFISVCTHCNEISIHMYTAPAWNTLYKEGSAFSLALVKYNSTLMLKF